jgi:deoxyribodipyrimidine photo-lyase
MNDAGLFWYRGADLRIDDQPSLNTLHAECPSGVFGAFVLEERWLREVDPGFARMSNRRLEWLFESLAELKQEWRDRGSELFIAVGKSESLIPQWAELLGVKRVATAPLPCPEEDTDTVRTERGLAAMNVRLDVHRDTTLLALNDLPFGITDLPSVFTSFRRQVEADLRVNTCVEAPARLAAGCMNVPDVLPRALPGAAEVGRMPWESHEPDDGISLLPWAPGTAGGVARLHEFTWKSRALSHYKETRNGLLERNDASRLSPWLAHGSLSARQIYWTVREYEAAVGANESTYWLIFELLWRDYFHLWSLKHGDAAFRRCGVKNRELEWLEDRPAFERWRRGETSSDFVNAGMRELSQTGYLSNRLRQNAASWLARNRHIEWRWGARWFESQLVDFDPCVNWGNWQYLAGVGNDPRDRVFNVEFQAERYDPDGAYRTRWNLQN